MPLTPSPSPACTKAAARLALYGAARFALPILLLLTLPLSSETRPHYGGTLRVEILEAYETPEAFPVPAGFTLTTFEPSRRAILSADENAPAGRPFLDSIEIHMGRPLRDQSADLELGKTDLIQLGANELRRLASGRRVWTSPPVRFMALVFGPRVDDPRVREAIALAVDRAAIHTVLLQRQGDLAGGFLPQWLSGYAFLFNTAPDLARARSLLTALPPTARTLSLGVSDPASRSIADRIALNARDAGLTVSVVANNPNPSIWLVEARIASDDPSRALSALAVEFGLPEPPRAAAPEPLYAAERALLEAYRVVPLFHLPEIYGVSQRIKSIQPLASLGGVRYDALWVEP
jgi:ABC-type transport system substrate-binding protein